MTQAQAVIETIDKLGGIECTAEPYFYVANQIIGSFFSIV